MSESLQSCTQTKRFARGTEVHLPPEPAMYFHPESGTLFYIDEDENAEFEKEANLLSALIEERITKAIEYASVSADVNEPACSQPLNQDRMKIQQVKNELTKAVDALVKELEPLTTIDPQERGKLHDDSEKDKAIRMVELIKVKKDWGKKYTYVKSDKIKNHWRKYKLNPKDYLIFKGMTPEKSNEPSTHNNNDHPTSIDESKFKSAMKKAVDEMKDTDVRIKLWDLKWANEVGILGDWAKDINERLKVEREKSPDGSSQIDFGAEAQLMRYSYGAGTSGEYNPFKLSGAPSGELAVGFNFYGNFDLCAGKASASLYIPDKKGLEITYPNKYGGISSLGHFRFQLEAKAYGSAGASGAIHANVKVDTSGIIGVKGDPQTEQLGLPGGKKVDLQKVQEQSAVNAELGVFLGAEAGGNIAGTFGWKNPELNNKFTDLAKLGVGASVMAGGGAKGAMNFTFINGKLRVLVKAALCWGVGAKGEFQCEIDANTIATQFLPCFTYMLRNVDYIKVAEMMEAQDFAALCAFVLLAPGVAAAAGAVMFAFDEGQQIVDKLQESYQQAEFCAQLMQHINNSPDYLKHSPPESKGSAIAMLLDTSIWDQIMHRAENHTQQPSETWQIGSYSGRKMAILNCFRWVQSKRDYENVLQHLSLIPGKNKTTDWRANEAKVIAFLQQGELASTNRNPQHEGVYIANYNSTYALSFKTLYDSLPDAVEDERAVLKPISNEIFNVGAKQTRQEIAPIPRVNINDVFNQWPR